MKQATATVMEQKESVLEARSQVERRLHSATLTRSGSKLSQECPEAKNNLESHATLSEDDIEDRRSV